MRVSARGSRARACPARADRFATRLPYLAYVVDDSVTALEGALEGRDGTLASLGTAVSSSPGPAAPFAMSAAGAFASATRARRPGRGAWPCRWPCASPMVACPPDPLAEALMEACPPHPVLWAQAARPGDFAQLVKLVVAHPDSAIAARVLSAILDALRDGLAAVGHAPGAPLVLTGGLGDEWLTGSPARGFARRPRARRGPPARRGAAPWRGGCRDLADRPRPARTGRASGAKHGGCASRATGWPRSRPSMGRTGTDLSEAGTRAW